MAGPVLPFLMPTEILRPGNKMLFVLRSIFYCRNNDEHGYKPKQDNSPAIHNSPALSFLIITLLPVLSIAKSSGTFENDLRVDQIDISVRELQKGRPTITGQPTYQKGAAFSGASTFTDTARFTGEVTLTNKVSVSSGVVFSLNGSSLTAQGANTLYANNFIKAWGTFDASASSVTLRDSFGVSTITAVSAGLYSITLESAMANTFYAIVCTVVTVVNASDGVICQVGDLENKSTTGFRLRIEDNAFGNQSPTKGANFMVIGRQ